MDKIKEVQQILNNHALPTDNGGFIRDSLDGSEFNKIARDIVKLFAIPAVVWRSEQLVCEHPDEALVRDKPTEYCMACGMNI